LVNETCVRLRKPLVEGGVKGFNGLVMTILPGEGPCYCCVFPPAAPAGSKAPASEKPIPVFATSPGVIGILQAHEALRLLLKVGIPLAGRILFYDGLTGSFYEQEVKRAPKCPCCGDLNPAQPGVYGRFSGKIY
jgi:adenylyltransferase/sulfurtransferase